MLTLSLVGEQIASRRKSLGLSQTALARQAGVGHSTVEALENGRLGELGFARISRLLSALGLELTLEERSARRPTLDDLIREGNDDQDLGRQR